MEAEDYPERRRFQIPRSLLGPRRPVSSTEPRMGRGSLLERLLAVHVAAEQRGKAPEPGQSDHRTVQRKSRLRTPPFHRPGAGGHQGSRVGGGGLS